MSKITTAFAATAIVLLVVIALLLVIIAFPAQSPVTRPPTVTPIGTLEPLETASARLYATYADTLDAIYTHVFTPLPR